MTTVHRHQVGEGRYIDPAPIPDSTVTSAHELKTSDGAKISGILRTVPGATTVAFLMHPRQDFSHHVLVPEFLIRGYAVWTQNARAGSNDVALLHEQALLDMAAGHVFLREAGFEEVVSVGHSGGGTLAAYYIEQASLRGVDRVSDTPGGKPIPLSTALMPVPDGLMMMAPHPGQGQLLLNMIDPSVADENDPLSVVDTLDPYSPRNGFRVPPESSAYSSDFVDTFRAAQYRRVERIDTIAKQRVERSREAGRRFDEGGDPRDRRIALGAGIIAVHRTDADLRGVDLSIDRNDRPYGSLFGKRPDLTNYGIVGFGRLTTPEAWLSTWSGISSRANLLRCVRGVAIPTLLVELTGDQASFPNDAIAVADAVASDDVSHVRVPGRHFGAALESGGTAGATLAGRAMTSWLGQRFPTGSFVSM